MSTVRAEARTRWVHTGIEAPCSFTVTRFNKLETDRSVAYSAELMHPTSAWSVASPTGATADRQPSTQLDLLAV
ncbi:hypothetical protein GCM10010428_43980 [Actinosynnema pretiosum subsp. pretiosum]